MLTVNYFYTMQVLLYSFILHIWHTFLGFEHKEQFALSNSVSF